MPRFKYHANREKHSLAPPAVMQYKAKYLSRLDMKILGTEEISSWVIEP